MLMIIISTIGGILNSFFAGYDILMKTLICFIIIDYVTGVMISIVNHKVNSEIGYKGIFKKVLILFMIGIAVKLDIILNTKELRYIVIMFYIINEGISIIENTSLLGLPIPTKIKEVFERLKGGDN